MKKEEKEDEDESDEKPTPKEVPASKPTFEKKSINKNRGMRQRQEQVCNFKYCFLPKK